AFRIRPVITAWFLCTLFPLYTPLSPYTTLFRSPGPFAMGYVLWGMVLLVLAAVVLWWPAIVTRLRRGGEGSPSDAEGEKASAPGGETQNAEAPTADSSGAGPVTS